MLIFERKSESFSSLHGREEKCGIGPALGVAGDDGGIRCMTSSSGWLWRIARAWQATAACFLCLGFSSTQILYRNTYIALCESWRVWVFSVTTRVQTWTSIFSRAFAYVHSTKLNSFVGPSVRNIYISYGVRGGAVGWGTTNRKVAGSIPDWVTEWLNPSGRTMALGSTQPLTEMSTTKPSWG